MMQIDNLAHPILTVGSDRKTGPVRELVLYRNLSISPLMSPDVTEHDHCRYCGDSVPSDQAYCSVECYYKDQAVKKKEKMKETLLAVIAFAGVVGILLAAYFF